MMTIKIKTLDIIVGVFALFSLIVLVSIIINCIRTKKLSEHYEAIDTKIVIIDSQIQDIIRRIGESPLLF